MSEDTVQRLMGLVNTLVSAEIARDYADQSECHQEYVRCAMDARHARATLESALREALMPAGWKLVPVEPTDEMEQAAADYLGACVKAHGLWLAMLSAAPSAFPVELEPEQPLGDAADAAGLSAPALRASAAIPIAIEWQRWAELLASHLHWLTLGGEFSAWLEETEPVMCYAAAKEWEQARDDLRRFNKERYRARDGSPKGRDEDSAPQARQPGPLADAPNQ